VSADREVFALSEATLSPSGTQRRLFGFKAPEHVLLGTAAHPAGIPVPDTSTALDLDEDALGKGTAYVAWKWQDSYGKLTLVNVDDPTNNGTWGVSTVGNLPYVGEPLRLRVHRFASPTRVLAYVTSFVCEGEGDGPLGPDFHCEEDPDCGGGPPPPNRRIFLNVLDVTNPASMTTIASHKIAETTPGCSERSPIDTAGMAFSPDYSKLFIANPDMHRLDVYDTETNLFVAQIAVGYEPVDVTVVRTAGPESEERAYVANRYVENQVGQSVSVVSVNTPTLILTIDLTQGELNLPVDPVAIATPGDGRHVFVANGTHGTIKVISIDTADLIGQNTVVRTIAVGSPANRLTFLTIPPFVPPE
jgi:hypothetical protein